MVSVQLILLRNTYLPSLSNIRDPFGQIQHDAVTIHNIAESYFINYFFSFHSFLSARSPSIVLAGDSGAIPASGVDPCDSPPPASAPAALWSGESNGSTSGVGLAAFLGI